MEWKLHQANENRKRRMINQNGPNNAQKYRNNSTEGFAPRNDKPPAQTYCPNYTNNHGSHPKPGGHHNNNNSNHNNNNNHPNGNNNNLNTAPRTGSNATPIAPKDKSTVTCYECGTVGHYSNECPKKLAKTAPNTATPAQQQRRFAAKRNPNNRNSRLYHLSATEAQEAPQAMQRHDVPRCAHVSHGAPERALAHSGHDRAPSRPVDPNHLTLSPLTHLLPTTPAATQTTPLARSSTIADALIDVLRHGYTST
ncbi:hypothetical protein QYE76_048797 [Lolium multiflorum]|uniref:CCHC-type domain-containing protein n=1 Tax=Lolium multiflorum TaxID=4521 RepID=A0AAD8WHM9_LOLMU|nr:hypothetical protein QYE76_048797 [Lolium multiflorum]